jgi:DUF1009 family protein
VGVEAGRTLMIEPERLIAEANRRNLVLVGLDTSTRMEA